VARRAPEIVPVDFALEVSDRDWLEVKAAAKELTPLRYLQRLIMYERRKDERNKATAARMDNGPEALDLRSTAPPADGRQALLAFGLRQVAKAD
tara:strand:- start:542 stop:823 length:282 start_codon:yes stop_codon:yes gene_type:complete